MRHLLFSLTVFCILINAVSCSEPQKSDKNIDLESIYEQNMRDSILVTGWYHITEDETGFKRQIDRTEAFCFVDPKPIVVKEHFGKLKIFKTESQGQHYEALSIPISKEYKDLWADATEKSIGRRIGFIVDNVLVTAPTVNMKIENGASSLHRWDYNRKELEELKKQIEK
jgi:preprotein translocase subunit SecD